MITPETRPGALHVSISDLPDSIGSVVSSFFVTKTKRKPMSSILFCETLAVLCLLGEADEAPDPQVWVKCVDAQLSGQARGCTLSLSVNNRARLLCRNDHLENKVTCSGHLSITINVLSRLQSAISKKELICVSAGSE